MRVAIVTDPRRSRRDPVATHVADLADALRASGCEVSIGNDFDDVDVVHAHASALSGGAYVTAVHASRARVPTVLTLHEMPLHSPLLLATSERVMRWTRTMVLSAVDSVVAAGAGRWMPEASIAILPRGVDAAYWRTVPARTTGAAVRVVTALPDRGDRNVSHVLRAFADTVRFVAGAPHLEMTALCGPRVARAVRRLATERGVGERVHVTDDEERDARRAAYAGADAYVDGGNARSLLEARAVGLPIVALLSSPARDVVSPGVNGLLARNDAELVRQLARIAIEEPLRRFMSHRSRADASPCDWETVVALHLNVYEAAAGLVDIPVVDSQP